MFVLNRGEFVPTLGGGLTLRVLKRMAEEDETIGAMLYAIETTLGQVDFQHIACDNGVPSNDAKAEKAAMFADTLLSDMVHSFADHCEEFVEVMWAGFACFEILPKIRDVDNSSHPDGNWGIHALAKRDQLSVIGWVRKDGDVVAMRQATAKEPIPTWKMLHYKLRGSRAKPQGRSLFTNAYRSWWLKRRIQDSEALGIERELCGLPTFSMPAEDIRAATTPDPDTGELSDEGRVALARVQAAQRAVKDMRLNEAGGLVLPSDVWLDDKDKPSGVRKYEFKIQTSAGQRSIDTNTAISRYDRAIARIAMMQFLHLGERSTGSYALSSDQSGLAMRSINFLIRKICEEWRRKALVLIWEMNGMDKRFLPKLQPSPLTEDSLAVIGDFLDKLQAAQDLLHDQPALAEAMIRRLGVRADPVGARPVAAAAPKPAEPEPAGAETS